MVLKEYSLHEQPIRMVSSKAQITEPDIAAIITRLELPVIHNGKKVHYLFSKRNILNGVIILYYHLASSFAVFG